MPEKILIVDDDVDTLRLVGIMLQRQGYQIAAAANGQQGLAKALEEKPDLILLDVMMPDMDGYEVTRRLRADPATAKIPILMFTAKSQLDDKVTGFQSGADDYLTKPTHPSELQAHIKALFARGPSQPKAVPERHGHVTGVLSARGGLGVSAIAVNLAVGLFTRSQSQVALAEMTPGKGTLGLDLGLPNQKALVSLLRGNPSEVTRERVKKALISHISGVSLLLASENPADLSLVANVLQYEALVRQLAAFASFSVLDMGSTLLPFVQKTLPLCDEVVVVVEGVPNTIVHTQTLIGALIGMGMKPDRIIAALNLRVRSDTQLPVGVVQEKLGHPISVTVTPAAELFTQATRMQTAAILCQPEGATARQFRLLADLIIQNEATV
ncbi:MAG: Sensor histidine kinase RcsC [Anaerolineales bacterium]|nr:Sensor histidine kinase RcsC [Anaerolineales bacterium]